MNLDLIEVLKIVKRMKKRTWAAENSNVGPEDVTPNEKGLLRYVGETVTDVRELEAALGVEVRYVIDKILIVGGKK